MGDIAVLYGALAITLILRYWDTTQLSERLAAHIGPFSALFSIWLLVLYLHDLYRYRSFRDTFWLFKKIARVSAISISLSIIVLYLFPSFFELTPKTNLLLFSVLFLLLAQFWRTVALYLFASGKTRVVILGNSPLINETAAYLKKNPHAGYELVEWMDAINTTALQKLATLVQSSHVHLVVIPQHLTKDLSMLRFIYQLLPLEVSLMRFSEFYEINFEKEPLRELDEGWFVENISTRRPFFDIAKRIFDIGIAIICVLVFFIPSLLITFFIAVTSKGPIIYSQKRIGKNGIAFTLYKFRTMTHNAEGALWTETNDTRITSFGKILRASHLDELPQLINILNNTISFVGPRPERTELSLQYTQFPYYDIRHVVKPGLTGWAQVLYKPSASLEEAYEKLCYDVYYIKNRSFLLDVVIFLKTIKYLFTASL